MENANLRQIVDDSKNQILLLSKNPSNSTESEILRDATFERNNWTQDVAPSFHFGHENKAKAPVVSAGGVIFDTEEGSSNDLSNELLPGFLRRRTEVANSTLKEGCQTRRSRFVSTSLSPITGIDECQQSLDRFETFTYNKKYNYGHVHGQENIDEEAQQRQESISECDNNVNNVHIILEPRSQIDVKETKSTTTCQNKSSQVVKNKTPPLKDNNVTYVSPKRSKLVSLVKKHISNSNIKPQDSGLKHFPTILEEPPQSVVPEVECEDEEPTLSPFEPPCVAEGSDSPPHPLPRPVNLRDNVISILAEMSPVSRTHSPVSGLCDSPHSPQQGEIFSCLLDPSTSTGCNIGPSVNPVNEWLTPLGPLDRLLPDPPLSHHKQVDIQKMYEWRYGVAQAESSLRFDEFLDSELREEMGPGMLARRDRIFSESENN